MKPRTKKEILMVRLAKRLPPITSAQKIWAFRHCFSPKSVYRRRPSEIICMKCGWIAPMTRTDVDEYLSREEYTCPICGCTSTPERYEEANQLIDIEYFVVMTRFGDYQVTKVYEAIRDNRGMSGHTEYDIHDIYQIWLDSDGHTTITGRRHNHTVFKLTWDYDSDYQIKKRGVSRGNYYELPDIYDISGWKIYPVVKVIPTLIRNGWDTKKMLRFWRMFSLADAMQRLLSVPDMEMLVKTRQYDIFLWMMRRNRRTLPYRAQVCIANRHGYIVHDTQMWMDTIEMAHQLGKDTHSPTIVCPPNLIDVHDRLMKRLVRIRREEEAKERRAESIKQEAAYAVKIRPYRDFIIRSDSVIIRPVTTVAEMAEEGDAMHHCVFSGEYYKKADSLILTARTPDGARLETVEVYTRNGKVLQSRGKYNQTTQYHSEIIKLVEAHAADIIAASADNQKQNAI